METENKKYDNKKYYQQFKETNKDKLNERVKCDICGGSYTYFNKSKHIQTKKHKKLHDYVEKTKDNKIELINILEKLRQLEETIKLKQ
jgi:hypothetical protein